MAKLIKVDGTIEIVNAKGKKWTLKEMQEHVGGFIEYMPSVGPLIMVFDEEAALRQKPVNQTATDMVLKALEGKILRYVPVIRGDVLVFEKHDRR